MGIGHHVGDMGHHTITIRSHFVQHSKVDIIGWIQNEITEFQHDANAVMRNDAHRQKSESLHLTNCIEIVKDTTTTYSSIGTTYENITDYDGEQIKQGKGFDWDLTTGEIVANESMIVHVSASLEFSHDASRDIVFTFLIDGNETGFQNFAERKAEHINLIGTFRVDAGQTLTIAMKLATAHTMDIDIDHVHFQAHEI